MSEPVDELCALLNEAGLVAYLKYCADCGHQAHQTAACRHCEHAEPSKRHVRYDRDPNGEPAP